MSTSLNTRLAAHYVRQNHFAASPIRETLYARGLKIWDLNPGDLEKVPKEMSVKECYE